MAEPFEKRAATALNNPLFRLADFGPLIAEGNELAEQQQVVASEAAVESVDFALSETDRDAAAAKADRARRNATALASAVEALTAKHAERQASEKSSRVAAERAAAISERDALAERFAKVVPEAIAGLSSLFTDVQANAERLKRAGLREPNAEAKARGIKGGYGVDWYTQLKIPAWDGKGRAWPPMVKSRDVHACLAESQRTIAAARAAELESRWGRYRVATADVIGGCSFKAHVSEGVNAEEVVTIYDKEWEGEITHTEAARLRKLGAIVDPLDPTDAAVASTSGQSEVAAWLD